MLSKSADSSSPCKPSAFWGEGLNFQINWTYVLAFAFFWTYGLYGSVSRDSIPLQIILTLIIVGYLAFIFTLSKRKDLVVTSLFISCQDLLSFCVISVAWFAVTFSHLTSPIGGDEFFHSLASQTQSVLALQVVNSSLDLSDYSFASVIHLFNLLLAGILIAIFGSLRYLALKKAVLLIIAVTLLTRYFAFQLNTPNSPHPPFQLFPIWLSTTIFGISDLTLRAPQLLGLIVGTFVVYRFLLEKLGAFTSLLVAFGACSVPLLIYVSTLVEGSIWAALILLILLVVNFSENRRSFHFWFGVSSLLAIFTLLRLTSILLLPFFLLLLLKFDSSIYTRSNWKKLALLLSPFIVCLPFFWFTLGQGTPATYHAGETLFIPNDASTANRIYFALSNGIIFNTSLATLGNFWLMGLLGLVIKVPSEKNYWLNRLIALFVAVILFAGFFSIRPILWGADRYKAEYLVPFVVMGFILVFTKIHQLIIYKISTAIIASALFIYGINGFWNYPSQFLDPLASDYFHRTTEESYDYHAALVAAKKDGYSGSLLIVGNSYGIMPQIIVGYSVADVLKSKEIHDRFSHQKQIGISPINIINSSPDINMVLILDQNGRELHNQLLADAWVMWGEFKGNKSGTIYGFIRK